TSVLSVLTQNKALSKCEPMSVYHSAMVAATLDLPINSNLGFAYIVPYQQSVNENGVWVKKQVATFQLGYKGIKQLAIRSGEYANLDCKRVYEGQLIEDDSFLGYHFDWKSKSSDKVIGYASYFKLLSGFESIKYMSLEEVISHALEYSQSYKNEKTKKTSRW